MDIHAHKGGAGAEQDDAVWLAWRYVFMYVHLD